ncbi:hypothetical protein FDI63_gp007 [Mycobacterium phage ChrisnMich]|uniref:DUF1360 domain-containing protein n=1 Tax=Mycobacterium phage ChrisnMich TaxID=1034130 RepID=G1BL64_9CAUD|nr:hypothetical protein FDI63_gp007 [Mycobacterium phage ChrisnMich]AEJ94577.1 hypothetical protein CHRISNMICH_7 [Mycobacterium phage ChrisnMich]
MSLGEFVLVLVVYALAVMRLTRLINADTILDRPRLAIAGKAREARLVMLEARAHGQEARAQLYQRRMVRWNTLMYFVQCPWCVGMWLALGTAWVPLYFHTNPVAQYLGVALAVSHLIGVCARFADTEDMEIVDDDEQ